VIIRKSIVKALITFMAITFLSACSPGSIATPEPPSDAAVSTQASNASVPGAISISTVEQVDLLLTLSGHSQRVMSVTFSADGVYLASSSEDLTIRLWDVRHGKEVHIFSMSVVDMKDIAFSPVGNFLASGEAIWDVDSKQEVHTLERGQQFPAPVAFSPDGSLVAVALLNQAIQLWDVASGEVVSTFEKQQEFSPDGTLLAAGGLSGTVRLWDVESGQIANTLEYGDESGVHDLAFSPDGRFLATGGTVPTVRLWDVTTGEVVRTLRLQDGLFSVAFSPDGTILASVGGSERAVELWDVESGVKLRSLPHGNQLMAVTFSPDGKLLAAGCYDNQVYLWGISTEP
jgi:WD40 repeat protein